MKRDEKLDLVRCLMNYMIVVLHAWAAFQYVDHSTWEYAWCKFVCNYLCGMAMPTFFVISGFLMFQGFSFAKLPEKIVRRVKRLVVPYLVWNVTFVLFYLALAKVMPRLATRVHSFGLDTFSGAITKIISLDVAPIDGPLWFLRALFYFVLLTPAIWLGLRFAKGIPLLILALLWPCAERALGWSSHLEHVFPSFAVASYVTGAFIAVRGSQLKEVFALPIWLVVGFAVCGLRGALAILEMKGWAMPTGCGFVCASLRVLEAPALICLVRHLPVEGWRLTSNRVYLYLKDMSFFAYAGHFMFCSMVLHTTAPLFSFMATGKFTVLILLFVVVGGCVMSFVYGIARKLAPRFLSLYDGTL